MSTNSEIYIGILLFCLSIFGYIKNIINIILQFGTPLSELTLIIFFQIIGIPFFPLGIILGLTVW